MMKKVALFFAVAVFALASAKSYSIKLAQPVQWGGTELKPGDYKMEVVDQKAVIRAGKVQAEAAVRVEDGAQKYERTSLRLSEEGGKTKISEIRLGGTKTKVVFN